MVLFFIRINTYVYIHTYLLYAYMYIRVRNRVKFGKLENVSNDLKGEEGSRDTIMHDSIFGEILIKRNLGN